MTVRVAPRSARILVALFAAVAAVLVLHAALAVPAASQPGADALRAPAFAGSTGAATRGPARSIRIAVPTEAAPGDALLVGLTVRLARARGVRPPAGWTLIRADRARRRVALVHLVYLRLAGDSEPADYRWAWERRAAAAGGMAAYSGVDQTAPVEGHSGDVARRKPLPSLTTMTPGAVVIAFLGSSTRSDAIVPAGLTERYDVARARASASASDFVQIVPGAARARLGGKRLTGKRVRGAASGRAIGQMVALKPDKKPDREPGPKGTPLKEPLLDIIPPDTTIDSGPSGTVDSSSATFTFSSSEPGSTFDCRLDAAAWSPCTTPRDYAALADGSHTFDVRARDAAGNVDLLPASRSWTVDTEPEPPPADTTPPETAITSGPSGTTTSTSATFEFSSSESGSTFACRLDGGAWSGCSPPRSYSNLAAGSHTFEVRATDAAGNVDASPAVRGWTIEAAPPPPPSGGGASLPAPLAESTGTVFHVAKTGSDSNPGTEAAPWLTVQKALNTLQAGQRALVHAGTYTQALDLTRACAAAAPCTVEAAPGEPRPVLRITNDHVLRAETSAAYWRFRGFTFRDSDITSGGLIDLYGHHIEISASELTNSGDQAFYMDEASHHVQVLGNWIHHSGLGRTHQSHGAYLQGDDHLVANNLIHDMPYGFGIQVYDKGLRSIVVNNTIANNGHSGIVVGGGGGVSGVIVRNNVFANNNHYGIAWDGTCPNTSAGTTYADHNVIHGNGWGAIDPQSCPATNTSGGNRTTDPLFVDAAGRNYHLRAGSPAFGYALPEWAPGGDFDGEVRPQNGAADAGAYEDG